MVPVWGFERHVVPFVAGLAGIPSDFGNCRTLAVFSSDGELKAGVVFHNWNPQAEVIEISAASRDRRWIGKAVLAEVMGYAFGFCQMVVGRTAESNTPTRRLWKALGATETIIPRLRGRDAAEVVLCLTDEAWRASKLNKAGE